MHEYDNIPLHFKDYSIKSGRVTFKVAGEFEIDLTIADEDPEAQFWFIDFRFMFWPSVSTLTPHVRYHIESRVNEALAKDGLVGCYKYLHEMVLTHKISEFRRQAIDLARAKWIETLKVEALNRALSVQYWLDRYGAKGPRSWIILGVHSGKRKDGRPDPKGTSRLFIRWFRDSKEVPDVDIQFDTVNITTESLMKAVIARHVGHILTSIYDNLREKLLFANRELALSLSISSTEPAESALKVQLTNEQQLSIKIEPISGRFVFTPASRLITEFEIRLNAKSQNPANDAHTYIEHLRCQLLAEDIINRGLSVGWIRTINPGLKQDVLQKVVPKDTLQVLWFRRHGWLENWHVAVTMGTSGEHWLLLETYVFYLLLISPILTVLLAPMPQPISHPIMLPRAARSRLPSIFPTRLPRPFRPMSSCQHLTPSLQHLFVIIATLEPYMLSVLPTRSEKADHQKPSHFHQFTFG